MKTIGLIIVKNGLPGKVPEEEKKLPEEIPEAQTKGKSKKASNPKRPSKPKKPPKENEPPEIKAEDLPSEAADETDPPEEKEPENGAD